MSGSNGIQGFSIHETPIAVLVFETTGLTPGMDRVVDVSVYRLEIGKSPCLAFDTLVNPQRPVSATEIPSPDLESSMGFCLKRRGDF